MAYLVIEGPDGSTSQIHLGPGTVTLGRDPQCDIHLDDRLVSRQHVSISSGYIIEDLDSFNGIFVRGKRIQRAFILPGEGFRIGSKGKYEVRVMSEEGPGAGLPASDSGMTLAESSPLPPGRSGPLSVEENAVPRVLDPSEIEDRLQALQSETERLGRENQELRHRLADEQASGRAPRRAPEASAEAAASSSHTMSFEPRLRQPSSEGEPREEA